ncbi:MAG: hypothetical protein V2A54_15920 [Bacteroidota bacterium]
MKKLINKKLWISIIILFIVSSFVLTSCGSSCRGMKGYRSDVKRGIAH